MCKLLLCVLHVWVIEELLLSMGGPICSNSPCLTNAVGHAQGASCTLLSWAFALLNVCVLTASHGAAAHNMLIC